MRAKGIYLELVNIVVHLTRGNMKPILHFSLAFLLFLVSTLAIAQNKNVNNAKENHVPVFVKEMPDTFVWAGKTLLFQYSAFDPDGDSITYSAKSVLPMNSTLLSKTGVFTWRPFNAQRGMYELIIAASDGKLTTYSKRAILTTDFHVDFEPGTPYIAIAHNVGGEVSHSWIGDTVVVRAIPNIGYRFTNWTEKAIVVTTDSVYKFVITVSRDLLANFRVNHAPVFVKEMPDTVTYEGRNFVFTYKAIDPDGDTVKYYATSVFPSSALLIPRTGVFGWRPNHFQSGLFQIMIYASDGNMITYSRTASVKIYADCCMSGPPIIIRGLPEGGGSVSYSMAHDTITAIAVSNKGFKFLNWTEYGTVVSTDSAYTYVVNIMRNLAAHFTSTSSLYDEMGFPKNYSLSQNYPNPFNPETTISYSVPKSEHVTLKVFDVLGREVATLVNETKAPGNYSVKFNGGNLPSSIYFYQMTTQNNRFTNKMSLLK